MVDTVIYISTLIFILGFNLSILVTFRDCINAWRNKKKWLWFLVTTDTIQIGFCLFGIIISTRSRNIKSIQLVLTWALYAIPTTNVIT